MVFWEPSWIRIIFTPARSYSGRVSWGNCPPHAKNTPSGGVGFVSWGVIWAYLELLDGLAALADDEAGFPGGDHDLLHCPVLPVSIVVELAWGPPSPPRDDVVQHQLCLPGRGGRHRWVFGDTHRQFGVGEDTWGRPPTHCTASGDPVRETLRSGNPPLSVGRGGHGGRRGHGGGRRAPPPPHNGGRGGLGGSPEPHGWGKGGVGVLSKGGKQGAGTPPN